MKDMIKLVLNHFLIITVAVMTVFAIGNVIDGNEAISVSSLWQILLAGICGSLPTFIFTFKNEPTRKHYIIRMIIHFFTIELVIAFIGKIFGWYSTVLGMLAIACSVLVIYAVVVAYNTFIIDTKTAKSINTKLKDLNDLDDNE